MPGREQNTKMYGFKVRRETEARENQDFLLGPKDQPRLSQVCVFSGRYLFYVPTHVSIRLFHFKKALKLQK